MIDFASLTSLSSAFAKSNGLQSRIGCKGEPDDVIETFAGAVQKAPCGRLNDAECPESSARAPLDRKLSNSHLVYAAVCLRPWKT